MSPEARLSAASTVLGGHTDVPVELLSVDLDPGPPPRVSLALNLHYRVPTPVCCGEPGCYLPFLGLRRREFGPRLAQALQLPEAPDVQVTAHLVYEPGYRHTAGFAAVPCTLVYTPDELR